MKKYCVTFKSSLVLFGNNIFTKTIEAENDKEARHKIFFEGQGLHQVISVEEI